MSFRLKTSDALRTIGSVERTATAVNRSVYRAINRVAEKTMTRSRREIVSQVNLTQPYVRERMKLEKATPSKSVAIISARVRPTRLATFNAKQLIRKANARRAAALDARRRGLYGSGDKMRGIPAGSVSAGVSVKVKRAGSRKRMSGAFFVPLKRGTDAPGSNGMGVFIRTGTGRKAIKHLYGPSVDQVFSGVIEDIKPDVQEQLQEAVVKQAEYELKQAARK